MRILIFPYKGNLGLENEVFICASGAAPPKPLLSKGIGASGATPQTPHIPEAYILTSKVA